mmetsp:Transcript_21955/g.51362  ORF Transcript_21955/g.51362 Transcript_21955/m.51362 type:complete len:272 (+) Transcript_21955:1638-2453(+)
MQVSCGTVVELHLSNSASSGAVVVLNLGRTSTRTPSLKSCKGRSLGKFRTVSTLKHTGTKRFNISGLSTGRSVEITTSRRCKPATPMASVHDDCTSQLLMRRGIWGGGGSSSFFCSGTSSCAGGGVTGLAAFFAFGSSFFPLSGAFPPLPFSTTGSSGTSGSGGSTFASSSGPSGTRPVPFASFSPSWMLTGRLAFCRERMSFSVTARGPKSFSNSTQTPPVHEGLVLPSCGTGYPPDPPSGGATRLLSGPELTCCVSSPAASNHGTVTDA